MPVPYYVRKEGNEIKYVSGVVMLRENVTRRKWRENVTRRIGVYTTINKVLLPRILV